MLWLVIYLAVALVTYVLMRYACAREHPNRLGVREHALVVAYGLLWPAVLVLFLYWDRRAGHAEREQRIAALLVAELSDGCCPLDGPCSMCDCFDPEHRRERDLAAKIVEVL